MLLNHLSKKYSNAKLKRKDLTNVPYGKGKQLLHGLLEISIIEAKGLPDMDGKHTIRKVKFLSKSSILTKPQHFHEFFTQIFFDNFSREIKVVNS